MFTINWVNIKSALMYGLLWGVLAIFVKVSEIGNIFALDWKDLLNAGVMAFLAIMIVLLRNFFTSNDGKFIGVKVIPEIK